MPEPQMTDPLAELLARVRQRRGEVVGLVVASREGFSIAADLPPDVDEEELAALGAELLTGSRRAAVGLGDGETTELYVRSEQRQLVVLAVGPDAVLVALAHAEASLGMLLVELRRLAEAVGAQL